MATNGAAPRNALTVIGRGTDRPGIASAFMKSLEGHDCRVMSITQYLLSGALVFTFELEVGEEGSYRLMKDLRACGDATGLSLEFLFPDAIAAKDEQQSQEKKAVLSISTSKDIKPSELCGIDTVLSEKGCVIEEIEHRGDNKIEFNGEFNKLQMIVRCPPGCTLANLYLGLTHLKGLQVTLKWWNGMDRPHGKSLVVFGLSHVLCPYNVLDELLKEAGVDPTQFGKDGDEDISWETREKKIATLKGKSIKAAQQLIDRLEFTKGAELVCSTLKALGCRLAILTNSGESHITDHVKQKLGIDYMITQSLAVEDGCYTGKFGGDEDAADIRFRKLDLLKLMADREGIDYRNVIVVGEPLKGLKLANARRLLSTFGPSVHFHSKFHSNLAVVLYQLGFSGSHVKALRERYDPDFQALEAPPTPQGETVYFNISAPSSKTAHIKKVFESLQAFESSLNVSTVRQCSLQNGSMSLGIKLVIQSGAIEKVEKELLYACQKANLKVNMHVDEKKVESADGKRSNRHVITIVQQPNIHNGTLKEVFEVLGGEGVNVVRMLQLSVDSLKALSLSVALPEGMERSNIADKLGEVSRKCACDIAFQPDDVDRFMRRMIVFDMDSTLIQQEVIDELARVAGVEAEVKAITESAMRGEIDFFGSLKQRCALLKGANCDGLFEEVKKAIVFNPGAERLTSVLKKLGFKMAVLSGGFMPVAEEVQARLGLDYAFANTLDVDEETGNLTGCTTGPVVTPQRKRALLATISNIEHCLVQQTIAVGDGANDIPMLHTAGLGIAFCAKPKVQAVAEFRINQRDLSTVLFLIGLTEDAIERLADCSDADASGAPLMESEETLLAKRRRQHF